MNKIKKTILILLLLLFYIIPVSGQVAISGVKTAFLDFENINMDPALDYLGGIIKGLLLYDLSQNEYIKLVNRTELENVIEEQSLRLSGVIANDEDALQVGRILGADWLIKGEYIFLGRDVLITISLTNVETARVFAYSDRGSSENTIHGLAEKIITKLTGIETKLQNSNSIRSIISMKNESPGSVELYSWVSGAEIYLDDKFIGYTGEDYKIPYKIENVKSGSHRLRTHYWPFGEVDIPQMNFRDWQYDFEITSGEQIVIRANQKHFNAIIYDLQQLIRESYTFTKDNIFLEQNQEIQWEDMNSISHRINFSIKGEQKNNHFISKLSIEYDGDNFDWEIKSELEKREEWSETVKDIDVRLNYYNGRVDYSLWRNDIEQEMWHN